MRILNIDDITLDQVSNLNSLTRREILYDLCKSTNDLFQAHNLLSQLEQSGIIKFTSNIETNVEEVKITKKNNDYIVPLEELDEALVNLKSGIIVSNSPLSLGIGEKYNQLKQNLQRDGRQ